MVKLILSTITDFSCYELKINVDFSKSELTAVSAFM